MTDFTFHSAPAGNGMSFFSTSLLNMVADIGRFTDSKLRMLQDIADCRLDCDGEDTAKRIAKTVAQQVPAPTIRDLVLAFQKEPSLDAFARALTVACLPGVAFPLTA